MITNMGYTNIPTVYALHINGINTTRNEAIKNLQELNNAANIDSNMVKFDLVYNPTNTGAVNLIKSLIDIINQKSKEQQIITLDDYIQNYMINNPPIYPKNSPEYIVLRDKVAPAYHKQPLMKQLEPILIP